MIQYAKLLKYKIIILILCMNCNNNYKVIFHFFIYFQQDVPNLNNSNKLRTKFHHKFFLILYILLFDVWQLYQIYLIEILHILFHLYIQANDNVLLIFANNLSNRFLVHNFHQCNTL